MPKLALSTMWCIGQFASLADFFEKGQSLGFTRFELNHGIDSAMLQGIDLDGFRITSVHEPCPADISTSVLKQRNWLVSATDEEQRRQGVTAICRSIDLAQQLGAPAVIVHPGRVDIDEGLEMKLLALYRQGQADTPAYAEARRQLMVRRAGQAATNMRSVRRSILELAEYATAKGIWLGLENRYHYFEIPLPDELDELLGLDVSGVVGYWHDVGHAQTLENLGFFRHEEWLRRFSPRIVGVHLHDITGINDHLAAGLGHMDWNMVARYLPVDALRTCEFQNNNSPAQVAAGIKHLIHRGLVTEA